MPFYFIFYAIFMNLKITFMSRKKNFFLREIYVLPFYCLSVSLYDDMHLVRDLKMNINHLVFAQ